MAIAAFHENTSIVKLLLAHGADPAICNCRGKSAFSFAKSSEALALLREYGEERAWEGCKEGELLMALSVKATPSKSKSGDPKKKKKGKNKGAKGKKGKGQSKAGRKKR